MLRRMPAPCAPVRRTCQPPPGSALGSTMLATSLVADLQLVAAAVAWGIYNQFATPLTAHQSATIVSFAIGAMVANVVSVVLLVIEMANLRR